MVITIPIKADKNPTSPPFNSPLNKGGHRGVFPLNKGGDREVKDLLSSSAQNSILAVFEKNGIIAYPTETFYGLGVNPFNEAAIKNLFKLKERTADKPISILIKDKNMLFQIADEISPKA